MHQCTSKGLCQVLIFYLPSVYIKGGASGLDFLPTLALITDNPEVSLLLLDANAFDAEPSVLSPKRETHSLSSHE